MPSMEQIMASPEEGLRHLPIHLREQKVDSILVSSYEWREVH